MSRHLFKIDISQLNNEEVNALAKQIIDSGKDEIKEEYQKAVKDITIGFQNAVLLGNSEAWAKVVGEALVVLKDFAKKSNPLKNGSPYELFQEIQSKAPEQIQKKISKAGNVLDTITAITQSPLLKSFISTNPIASSVSSIVSTVAGLIGQGTGSNKIKSEHVSKFSISMGEIVERWEKFSVVINALGARTTMLQERQASLKERRKNGDVEIVINIVHGEFNSEEAVRSYLSQNSGNNFSYKLNQSLYVDENDYDTMYDRLYSNTTEAKRFQKGLYLARLSTELMSEADALFDEHNSAIEFATNSMKAIYEDESKKINSEQGLPEMSSDNWAAYCKNEVEVFHANLCADGCIEKGLKKLRLDRSQKI